MSEPVENEDFYWEGKFIVFTRVYHLKRGSCCGSGCRHCPYDPRWTSGSTAIASNDQRTTSPNDKLNRAEINSTGDDQ